jgi:hypothetical protein
MNSCSFFGDFCIAASHLTEIKCTMAMLAYYQVNPLGYVCPTCRVACSDSNIFIQNHRHHLGPYNKKVILRESKIFSV